MKKRPVFSCRKLAAALVLTVLAVSMVAAIKGSSRKIRIMPLGDSITEGRYGTPSYRFYLWQSLVEAGFGDNTEFVGTNYSSGLPGFDCSLWPCAHNGFPDRKIADIIDINNVDQLFARDMPDVVLLHLGTNDVYSNGPGTLISIQQMGWLIDTIRNCNPRVVILLCKIIPAGLPGDIEGFNNGMAAIAAAKTLPASPVILVDQFTDYNPSADNADGVHPNESGERKMARKFLDSLLPVLAKFNGLEARIDSVYTSPGGPKSAAADMLSAGGRVYFDACVKAYPAVRDVIFTAGAAVAPGVMMNDSLYQGWFDLPQAGQGSGLFSSVKVAVNDFSGRSDTSATLTLGVPNNVTAVPPQPQDIPEFAIPMIQGETDSSMYRNCVVKTTGVVTAVTADSSGFWIQDTIGDNNQNTSDAVFVFRNRIGPMVVQGDLVIVSGMVEEYKPIPGHGSTTRLRCFPNIAPAVTIIGNNHALPAPETPYWLPDQDLASMRSLYASHEGMLARWSRAPIVAPSDQWGLVSAGNYYPGAGFYWSPSLTINESRGLNAVDYNPETVLLGSKTMAPPRVRSGDTIFSLTGVVDFDRDMYYIQPLPDSVHVSLQTGAPASPVSKRASGAGSLRITTFDLDGFFDTLDTWGKNDPVVSGDAYTLRLNKTAMAIAQELLKPAILCVQNVENTRALSDIAAKLNASYNGKYKAATARAYMGASVDTPATPLPRGLINGFLYDSTIFSLGNAFLLHTPAVDSAFGAQSPVPTAQPLAGVFTVAGQTLGIVNLTLADKSRDRRCFAKNWPAAEASKTVRKAQARAVRSWINSTLDAYPGVYLLVTGEFNDYPFPEPLDGQECPVSIVAGNPGKGETVFLNVYDCLPPDSRYTCIADGRAMMTSNMLISPSLAPLASAVDVLHFNALFEEHLASDPSTPCRCSRHDAVELRF